MKRKITNKLIEWKNEEKKALLIYGARQVGKTYIIEKFIKENFDNVIKIDFAQQPSAIPHFINLKDKDEFYLNISLYGNININNTVIFFDEIQELYSSRKKEEYTTDLISIIKSLVIDNKVKFILSGSMLGVTLNNIHFNPMGYLDLVKMYPLDFEEYLLAKNITPNIIDELKSCFDNKKGVPPQIHKTILNLFNEYIIVGGMPEVVKKYIETKDITQISNIQQTIINYYQSDITKYAPIKERLLISEAYSLIPSELNSKNKRFIKTHIDYNSIKNIEMMEKYLWLKASGIAIPIYNVTNPISPLKISQQRKTLKLFSSDIGLLNNQLLNINEKVSFINGSTTINYGAQFENVVAQELNSHGYEELHYYNSKKSGEVDFILENKTKIIPIEIKSGKTNNQGYFDHKALNNLVSKYKYDNVYILSNENIKKEGIITYLPVYMSMFL